MDIFKCVNIAELSRETKIPESTLRSWREHPGRITLAGFRAIVRAMEMEDSKVLKIIKGSKYHENKGSPFY